MPSGRDSIPSGAEAQAGRGALAQAAQRMLVAAPFTRTLASAPVPHQVKPMFSSPAYAQSGAAASGGLTAMLVQFAPLLLIFVIFYFLLIRPQSRRVKEHRDMISAVKRNDVAVTSGGLIGKVTKVEEGEIELEIASGTRVRVVKSMLSEIRPHGAKPAND
jgi:preprotein translocase subunit YajC